MKWESATKFLNEQKRGKPQSTLSQDSLLACCMCVFVCVWVLASGSHTGRGWIRCCADLHVLSNGIDPVHLLLVVRSLDEVMGVWLSDDFKQVALNVAFHTCGKPDQDPDISTNPVWVFRTFSLKCDSAAFTDVQRLWCDWGDRMWVTWGNAVILQWGNQTASQGEAASGADVILTGVKKQRGSVHRSNMSLRRKDTQAATGALTFVGSK